MSYKAELLAELRTFIEDFMDDTGLDRHEFVIVCHPDCPVIIGPYGNRHKMLDGVIVVTHESMFINGISLFPNEEIEDMDDLAEMIQELDLDKPDGSGIGYGIPLDKRGIIPCYKCGHPISLALATEKFLVVCPWCDTTNGT